MSSRSQMFLKDDPELLSEDALDQSSDFTPRKRNTTAIYSDNLRFLIIQAIAARPFLWDTKSREPLSLVSRKKSFAEIAEDLSTDEVPLQSGDVEKQWKNLKDTYYKVKKKYVEANANNPSEPVPLPKWRFYSALCFIDQIDDNEQPIMEPVEEESHRTRKRKSTSAAAKETREAKKVVIKTHSEPIEHRIKLESPPKTLPAGPLEEEDDYSAFCRYLNGKLREIGGQNRTEFLRVQKHINDIIFDAQIKLSETNGHQANGNLQ